MSDKTHLELVREKMPDLVESWESMSKEKLLKEIAAEVLDLWDMQKRVSIFMEDCTMGLSYTTYASEVIQSQIYEKQKFDISAWCFQALEDAENDPEELFKAVKEEASNYKH